MRRTQTSLRGSVEDLEARPDALIPYIKAQPYAGALAGGDVTRSDVLRIALAEGLQVLEGRAAQAAQDLAGYDSLVDDAFSASRT